MSKLAEAERPLGPKTVLGIFAKEPLPGRVKTRLCPPLAAAAAADLYRVMLAETVTRMQAGSFALVIFYAGAESYFRSAFPGLPLIPQAQGDLGRRLDQALATLLERDYTAAALIGSDSPDLPLAAVEAALTSLGQADAVIIPADDGGYVLIGERNHQPGLFRDIPWSTPQVLEETRNRAAELTLDFLELAPWEDLDDLASLQRLLRRSPQSATARYVLAQFAAAL